MKYTLITGATGGIGRALAIEYATRGHSLILLGRNRLKLEELVQSLKAINSNNQYHYYSIDLQDTKTLIERLEEINEQYEIQCVIHNAGIGIFEDVVDIQLESLQSQLTINVEAPIMTTKMLLSNVKRNHGSMIYVCSILSDLPNKKASVYVASKHALLGFANTIRLEHPTLHVLTVHPITVRTGFFQKELKQQRFLLEPTDVARKIYRAYRRRKRRLNLPRAIFWLRHVYLWFPRLTDNLNVKFFTNK